LLLPANLFILDVVGLTFSENSVGEAFSSWVWSTPFFVLNYAMTGMKQAFWAGAGSMLMAAAVFRYMGPNSDRFSLGRTTATTAIVSSVAVVVIMFGPLGIFKPVWRFSYCSVSASVCASSADAVGSFLNALSTQQSSGLSLNWLNDFSKNLSMNNSRWRTSENLPRTS
jgi:hypothetical protein